jgi:hypothetical protein
VDDALRPLTIGELLDRTFLYYRRHFVLFVGIAALSNLLSLVLGLLFILMGFSRTNILLGLMSSLAIMFVYLVSTVLSQGATIVAVSQIQLDKPVNVAEAFKSIQPRIGELVILSLNVGIRVTLGFILLVVPGILAVLKYSLAVPVAVLEDRGISDTLSRSAELTQGHRGRIFVIYVLLVILLMIGTSLWQVPASLLISAASGSLRPNQLPAWAQVILQLGRFVSQSVFGPIMTIALALVYYDERVRKEGFDLEHMMKQLDSTALGTSPNA